MKVRSKFLTIALSLALVLTTVFAGTESAFAETAKLPDGPVAKAGLVEEAGMMKAAADTNEVPATAAVNLNTTESQWLSTGLFDNKGIYIPVSIPAAGSFVFDLLVTGDTKAYLFDSMNDDAKLLSSKEIPAATSSEDSYKFTGRAEKAGTYYLILQSSSYSNVDGAVKIGYAPARKSGGTISLTSGKKVYNAVAGSGYRYYKITTPGTRYLTIEFPWGDGETLSKYKVKLMDSKKKKNLLKGVVTVDEGRDFVTYAGVPKGTYYVAVSTTTDTVYNLKVTSKKVSENSGSIRSKAKRIYKGSSKSGVITATQSSTSGDWYKMVVGSSQYVNLEVITKTGGYNGGLKISVYSGNASKAFGTSEFYYGAPNDVLNVFSGKPGDRLTPGTYYIKVQKYGCGSGYYKLKWL